MTKQTWAERLTPFTGVAAIAVLIVALVVQPALALTPACQACINFWSANSDKKAGQPCFGIPPGPQLQQCIQAQIDANCRKVVSNWPWGSYTTPCPGSSGPGYTDCTLPECSFVSCDEWHGTVCTKMCNSCDATHNCNQLQQFVPVVTLSPCYEYCGCGNPPSP